MQIFIIQFICYIQLNNKVNKIEQIETIFWLFINNNINKFIRNKQKKQQLKNTFSVPLYHIFSQKYNNNFIYFINLKIISFHIILSCIFYKIYEIVRKQERQLIIYINKQDNFKNQAHGQLINFFYSEIYFIQQQFYIIQYFIIYIYIQFLMCYKFKNDFFLFNIFHINKVSTIIYQLINILQQQFKQLTNWKSNLFIQFQILHYSAHFFSFFNFLINRILLGNNIN
eukprot:TRINITY_DN4731_c0_g2_i3.p2 TRINITY_DN4731_c0_g2~~TRINITY_DN4731_c0_g2_i3.p2  ORF type:complete len:251 (+),score=-20.47 TRINITY_DN4731_c0_g2_i3:73-753(+)